MNIGTTEAIRTMQWKARYQRSYISLIKRLQPMMRMLHHGKLKSNSMCNEIASARKPDGL